MTASLVVAIFVVLLLLVGEIALRHGGARPLPRVRYPEGVRPLLRKGGERGWAAHPGSHGRPGRLFTVLPDGSRYVGERVPCAPAVLFVGCSFTQGEGLADAETYPYLVQSLMSVSAENHGVGGYGTYQCLLSLRATLSRANPPSSPIVIYGMNGFHGSRNVAHPMYLWLLAHGSPDGRASMPSCRFDELGEIEHVEPRELRAPFPSLVERSALVTLILRRYYQLSGIGLERYEVPITKALLEMMQETVEAAGGRFAVLMLRFSREERREYEAFLRARGIDVIDGYHPDAMTPGMMLPDRHPNARIQIYWADRIGSYLQGNGVPRRASSPADASYRPEPGSRTMS